jgi:hypothetical protein
VWQGQFQLRFWTGSGVNSQSATENSPSPPKEHVWSSVCHTGTGQLSSIETFFLSTSGKNGGGLITQSCLFFFFFVSTGV